MTENIIRTILLFLNFAILLFAGTMIFKIGKLHKQHKKCMNTFDRIKKLLETPNLTPEQMLFRLIQIRETIDVQTAKDTGINDLIRSAKAFN